MKARPYQAKAITEIVEAFGKGYRRVLLCLCTGLGKTICATLLGQMAISQGRRVVFVVDRISLIRQTKRTFERAGIRVGYVWAGMPEDYTAPVQVVSVQTLAARDRAEAKRGEVARWRAWVGASDVLWIHDEGHDESIWGRVGRSIIDAPGEALHLVMTATPGRLSPQEGMGDVADCMVQGPWYRAVMEMRAPSVWQAYKDAGQPWWRDVQLADGTTERQTVGYLVRARYAMVKAKVDLTDVERRGGDFVESSLSKASNKPNLIEGMYREWVKREKGVRTAAFCAGIEHAANVAQCWAGHGWKVSVVTSEKTGEDGKKIGGSYLLIDGQRRDVAREVVFEALEAGEICLIASADALTTGWDCLAVEVGLMMRATESWMLWVQMIGRLLRPCARTGKLEARVYDQVGNTVRLGPVEYITGYKLEKGLSKGEKRKAAQPQVKECQRCGGVVPVQLRVCNLLVGPGAECGFEFWPMKVEQLGLTSVKMDVKWLDTGDKSKVVLEQQRDRKKFRELVHQAYHGNPHSKLWAKPRQKPSKATAVWMGDGKRSYPADEWWKGAVFGDRPTGTDKMMYLRHLEKQAATRDAKQRDKEPDGRWVEKYYRLEFGESSSTVMERKTG